MINNFHFNGVLGFWGKFIGCFALVPDDENLLGRFEVFFSSYCLFALDLDKFLGLFSCISFLI
jgi:hypothetical protein